MCLGHKNPKKRRIWGHLFIYVFLKKNCLENVYSEVVFGTVKQDLHRLMKNGFGPAPHCLKITQNVAFEFLEFWHFPPIFVLLKLACLVTLFDRKLQVFKNSQKWTFFGIFN